MFSCAGNCLTKFDYATLCEYPPLSWSEEQAVFAIAIIQEAEDILSDTIAGLTFLNEHPTLLTTLQHNVQRIYTALDKQKNKRDDPKV